MELHWFSWLTLIWEGWDGLTFHLSATCMSTSKQMKHIPSFPMRQICCFCSCATPVWTVIVTALPSLTMATYVKNAELSSLALNVLEIWRGEWSLAVHQRALRHSEADSCCSLGLIQRGFSSHRIKLFTVWFPSCRSWEVSGSVQDTKSHKQDQGVYEFLWRWQQPLLLFQMCNAVGPERHHS